MTWVLLVLVHVGMMGKTDSNSLAAVPGFATQQECQAAGRVAGSLVGGTVKELRYVCVQQTRAVAP